MGRVSKLSNSEPKLHIILVDTALELIPREFLSHPSVQKNIKKFGNWGRIFDTSLHHSLINQIENGEKRGRPDILHHFLLDALGSPSNLYDRLKIYFHTPRGLYLVDSSLGTFNIRL